MAVYTQINDMFTRQSSLDNKYFDEEDTTLDENILSSSDFATSDYGVDLHRSSTPRFSSNNPFRNPSLDLTSGSTTPMPSYDNFATDFDPSSAAMYIAKTSLNGTATPFDLPHGSHSRPLSIIPSNHSTASIPESPLSAQDWMSSLASEDLEARQMPRKMRHGGPRPGSPVLRPDGIRKKNARFEIPAERNLHNIDHLITQSTDDQEIKELKQQKRLLRNRQAALDSRQRKKMHTERLEEEKKYYTERINDLEEKVASLELRNSSHMQNEDEWRGMQHRYDQFIENIQFEKEEIIRKYTLETADLRKKNTVLLESVQKLEASTHSQPASNSFSTDLFDFEGSLMEGAFDLDFGVDQPESKPSTALVSTRKSDIVSISEQDKPAASGLLLILLLCGAFVASKGPTSSSSAIPQMPDNIREASATVLDNMFKDAGVPRAEPALMPAPASIGPIEPLPSAWPGASSSTPMIGLSDSSLDILNQRLISPSKEQETEQLFSLSAEQYNSITSQDFGRAPETSSSSYGRRNLEASLAAMRAESDSKGSVAHVYTRSLLLDKVPAEVVRDFAKLVAEHNKQEASPDGTDAD